MIHMTHEPPAIEIWLTKALGFTVLSPYYREFSGQLGLDSAERVLEYGSRSGSLTRHLAALLESSGGRLDCVDISPGWMNSIRTSLPDLTNVFYHLGWVSDLGLPERVYDAVVVHRVFHKISENDLPEAVISLAAKLKIGGRLLVREPVGQGLSVGKLTKLARRAGLELQAVEEEDKPLIGVYFDAHFVKPIPD